VRIVIRSMETCRVPPAVSSPSLALWLMGAAALGMAVYVAMRFSSNQRRPLVPRATRGHVRRARTTVHFVDADASFVDVAEGNIAFLDGVVANANDVSIIDRGTHLANGNGIRIKVIDRNASPPEATARLLHFPSRFAVEAFRDVLHHAQGNMGRPGAVTLALSTWNLGNAQPPSDLSRWFNLSGKADIVAVGTQECSYAAVCATDDGDSDAEQQQIDGDLATASPASRIEDTRSSRTRCQAGKEHWQAMLHAHFSKLEYVKIIDIASWDRCLAVFAKRSVANAVSRVGSDTAFVGIGGVAGNKGAIGVRFAVYDTEFVIVNSHLAAHQAEVHRRNEDFASIVGSLSALRDHPRLDLLSSTLHHVFWLGDLNYRVDLKREHVCQLVDAKDFGELAKADQLGKAIRSGEAFLGFEEGELSFPPTYRFERGSRKYETTKMRVPSYTDRVLWHTLPGIASPKLQSYFSVDSILTSDHNPVVALFEAPLVHTSGLRKMEEIGEDVSQDDGLFQCLNGRPRQDLLKHTCSRFDRERDDMGPNFVLEFTNLSGRDLPAMDGTTQFLLSKVGSSLSWASRNAASTTSSPTSSGPEDALRGGDGVSRSGDCCLAPAGADRMVTRATADGTRDEHAMEANADAGTDSGTDSGSTTSDAAEEAANDDENRRPSETGPAGDRSLDTKGMVVVEGDVGGIITGEGEEGAPGIGLVVPQRSGVGMSASATATTSRPAARDIIIQGARVRERESCDPYCVFLGDAVAELQEGEYRSAVLAETQNPVWDACRGEVPLVWLADTAAAVVRRRHLTITVMDADAGPTDDVVGSVVVWLGAGWRGGGPATEAPAEAEAARTTCADGIVATAAFDLPILHRGRPRGWLHGRYIIRDRRLQTGRHR
jgi:hypothetical protein